MGRIKKRIYSQSDNEQVEVRLDKWLWAARFYKTRNIAHLAIESGRVFVDGVKAKPGRLVDLGQSIAINLPSGQISVIVTALSKVRGPASNAKDLYSETAESVTHREATKLIKEQQLLLQSKPPEKRPFGEARRALRRLKEGDNS